MGEEVEVEELRSVSGASEDAAPFEASAVTPRGINHGPFLFSPSCIQLSFIALFTLSHHIRQDFKMQVPLIRLQCGKIGYKSDAK